MKNTTKGILIALIIIAIVIILGTSLAARNSQPVEPLTQNQSATTTNQVSDWKTYTNEKYGFSFKYPAHLTPRVTNGSEEEVESLGLGTVTNLFAYSNIDQKLDPEGLSFNIWFSNLKESQAKTKLINYFKEYKFIDLKFGTTTIGGKIAYTYEDGGAQMGEIYESYSYLIPMRDGILEASIGNSITMDERGTNQNIKIVSDKNRKLFDQILSTFTFTK